MTSRARRTWFALVLANFLSAGCTQEVASDQASLGRLSQAATEADAGSATTTTADVIATDGGMQTPGDTGTADGGGAIGSACFDGWPGVLIPECDACGEQHCADELAACAGDECQALLTCGALQCDYLDTACVVEQCGECLGAAAPAQAVAICLGDNCQNACPYLATEADAGIDDPPLLEDGGLDDLEPPDLPRDPEDGGLPATPTPDEDAGMIEAGGGGNGASSGTPDDAASDAGTTDGEDGAQTDRNRRERRHRARIRRRFRAVVTALWHHVFDHR